MSRIARLLEADLWSLWWQRWRDRNLAQDARYNAMLCEQVAATITPEPCHCRSSASTLFVRHRQVWQRCDECRREQLLRGQRRAALRTTLSAGDTIVLFSDNPDDHVRNWLTALQTWFEQHDIRVVISSNRLTHRFQQLLASSGAAHVLMWNGECPHHAALRLQCAAMQVPLTIVEVGYFPQRDYYVLDPVGINATSTLVYDDLSWLTPEHFARLDAQQKSLSQRYPRSAGDYLLCPLQLEHDTNIVNNFDGTGMQQFIDTIDHRFRGQPVVYKVHPLDPNRQRYRTSNRIITDGDFLALAAQCHAVIGINSTALLEAVLLGVPTEATGRGFLQAQPDRDRLLAALIDRQVPVDCDNPAYWLREYAGIVLKHAAES